MRALAALALVAWSCTSTDRAKLESAAEAAGRDLDKACAERAAMRDGGAPIKIVTDGCQPDASDSMWTCTGDAGDAP